MSLRSSVKLVSKMILRSLLIFIPYTNVIYAASTDWPFFSAILSTSTEKSGSEVVQMVAEEIKPIRFSDLYTATEHINIIQNGTRPTPKPEKYSYLLRPDEGNELYPLAKSRNRPSTTSKPPREKEIDGYLPLNTLKENEIEVEPENNFYSAEPSKRNQINLAIITIPLPNLLEVERTITNTPTKLLPELVLKEDIRPFLISKLSEEKFEAGARHIMKEIPLEQTESSMSPVIPHAVREEYYATRPNGPSVIQEAQPLRLQEALTPISKVEVLPHQPLKPHALSERSPYRDASKYVQDSIPLLPTNTDFETTPNHFINKSQSDSYINPFPNDEDVLPLIVDNGHFNTTEEGVQKIQIDRFHEPLPPLSNHKGTGPRQTVIIPMEIVLPTLENISSISAQNRIPPLQTLDTKVPIQTIALPITEGSHPAAVIASGPYPENVSVLKDVPVAQIAEPLPPLEAVPTNVITPTTSALQVPQGPYPANLPIGHPYPPAI